MCLNLDSLLKVEPEMRNWVQKVCFRRQFQEAEVTGVWRVRQGGRIPNKDFTAELVTTVGKGVWFHCRLSEEVSRILKNFLLEGWEAGVSITHWSKLSQEFHPHFHTALASLLWDIGMLDLDHSCLRSGGQTGMVWCCIHIYYSHLFGGTHI